MHDSPLPLSKECLLLDILKVFPCFGTQCEGSGLLLVPMILQLYCNSVLLSLSGIIYTVWDFSACSRCDHELQDIQNMLVTPLLQC